MKKLQRSRRLRVIGGVAGGLSEYFDVDVTLVRLAISFAHGDDAKYHTGLFACVDHYPWLPRQIRSRVRPGRFPLHPKNAKTGL